MIHIEFYVSCSECQSAYDGMYRGDITFDGVKISLEYSLDVPYYIKSSNINIKIFSDDGIKKVEIGNEYIFTPEYNRQYSFGCPVGSYEFIGDI